VIVDSDPAKLITVDGTIVIPVGPANLNNMLVVPIDFLSLCNYTVTLRFEDLVTTIHHNYSVPITFPVFNNDCDCKNIIFLGEKGNWETLDTFLCDERTIQAKQVEICRSVPCNGTMQADGRRYQILTDQTVNCSFFLDLRKV